MKKIMLKLLYKKGYEIVKFPFSNPALLRRKKIIDHFRIGVVLDIGANTGQFAMQMRDIGFQGRIISFEPMNAAFLELLKNAKKDKNWFVYNFGLGANDGFEVLNISANSYSSSLLKILPKHLENDPNSCFISKEKIELKRLDSIIETLFLDEVNVMVKIDTQGFEKNVIDGGVNTLRNLKEIKIIQLEMSLVPLYEGEYLFFDLVNYLSEFGYKLFAFENGFSDSVSGQLLQVDGIFVKDF